jgi:hypothetical protein
MNNWYGNLTDGQSVRMTFNSYLLATGASTTVTTLIDSDVLVSKDGVSQTTQGAGVTVEIDKNATGAHFITIDTSNTTDAGFYDVGADYQVEFIGATIGGAEVNSVLGSFSIENRSDVVDLVSILGTALTETPGQLAAAFKKLFDVAVPTLVASDVMRGTDGGNTTVPDAAGVAPTAAENRQEMDANSTRLDVDVSSRAPSGEYNTQLDATMSSRAPASEYDTQLDANMSTRATSAKQDTMETTLDAVSVQTTRVDGLIEDSTGDRYTAKALEEAPSGSGGDATEAKQDDIIATLGTVPALDGAAQTVGAAIAKIADDNGGADFDATTDSLEKIRGAISSGGGTPLLK